MTALIVAVLLALVFLSNRVEGAPMVIGNRKILGLSQQIAADTIVTMAQSAGLNPAFMVALAVTESSLAPKVVGDDGISYGLFQIQLSTARDYEPSVLATDLLRPSVNARIAMAFMRDLIDTYPGHTYAAYAEAWALGGPAKFEHGKQDPQKVIHLQKAVTDLAMVLNVYEVLT